jgi:hypothetical protein
MKCELIKVVCGQKLIFILWLIADHLLYNNMQLRLSKSLRLLNI